MKNRIDFMTKYDTDEIMLIPPTEKRPKTQFSVPNNAENDFITRAISAPTNEMFRLQEHLLGSDEDETIDLKSYRSDKKSDLEEICFRICGMIYPVSDLKINARFGSIIYPETSGTPSGSNGRSSIVKKNSLNIYSHMRTGLKQRQVQISKRMRKTSVDREAIFKRLLVSQKIMEDQNVIDEHSAEHYDESSKYIDEVKETAEFHKTVRPRQRLSQMDKFMLNNNFDMKFSEVSGTESHSSESYNSKSPDDKIKQMRSDKELTLKRNSITVFNNNKFSMAVRYDLEKQDKMNLHEFQRLLKNTIISQEDFDNILESKYFEAVIDNFSGAQETIDKLRKIKFQKIIDQLLSTVVEISKAKIFLYTNENYSHINNKIDLDDHEIFKDIQNFANYMHEKHLKSLEKFRATDMKLKAELQDFETLKSIDVEIGGNVYIELVDMYKEPFQTLLDQLSDNNNNQELELEGIIYWMEPEIYDKIYANYLDRLEELAASMIKTKDISLKLKHIIKYYKKYKVEYLNMGYRNENPWLYTSN